MTSKPLTTPNPLSPSSSGNAKRERFMENKGFPSSVARSRKVTPDENVRPLGPTFAEELILLGEDSKSDQELLFCYPPNGCEDVTIYEIPVEDIPEIIVLDDMDVQVAPDSCCTMPNIPDDVAPLHGNHGDLKLFTNTGTSAHIGIDVAQRQGHRSHNLRDRHMSYLRDMHTLINLGEAKLPRAAITTPRPKWTIESGIVRSWSLRPAHRSPDYVTKYNGSAEALLRDQRRIIDVVAQKKHIVGSRASMAPSTAEVPRDVEPPYHQAQTQRREIEDLLRDAELIAEDLDEVDMDAVISAILSAAAQTALLPAQ